MIDKLLRPLCLLLLVVTIVLLFYKRPVNITIADSNIYKTVAHIDMDESSFELLWCDLSADVAYYRYIGERDLVNVGDTVFLYDGTECTIVATGYNGFTISSDTKVFYVGMSGDPILNEEGDQIGVISSLLHNGQAICIWS